MTITVLVADDQDLIRTGLRMILDVQPDLEAMFALPLVHEIAWGPLMRKRISHLTAERVQIYTLQMHKVSTHVTSLSRCRWSMAWRKTKRSMRAARLNRSAASKNTPGAIKLVLLRGTKND